MDIPPQHVGRRTLNGNVAPESSSFGVWPTDDEDFSSFGGNGLHRKLLALGGAEAVKGDSKGVPSNRFDFCKQVRVPVLRVDRELGRLSRPLVKWGLVEILTSKTTSAPRVLSVRWFFGDAVATTLYPDR